jgi:P-type Cu+ transporter
MTTSVKSISLPVQGMTCAGCVSHVEHALEELPGVTDVVANLATNKVNLTYKSTQVTLQELSRAISEAGYNVPAAELTLEVRGMTCASCVAHVEGALRELEGVTGATVNLGLGTARVTYIPGVVTVGAMKKAVQEIGYEAQEREAGIDALDRERQAREEEIKRQDHNRPRCWNHRYADYDRHLL